MYPGKKIHVIPEEPVPATRPELLPSADPEEPLSPSEMPDMNPDEDPFENPPPFELPEPGEGP